MFLTATALTRSLSVSRGRRERMPRTYNFDVGLVTAQLDRILQMELAGVIDTLNGPAIHRWTDTRCGDRTRRCWRHDERWWSRQSNADCNPHGRGAHHALALDRCSGRSVFAGEAVGSR